MGFPSKLHNDAKPQRQATIILQWPFLDALLKEVNATDEVEG